MLDLGPQSAAGIPIANPLPASWVGRIDAPVLPPGWAAIGKLSTINIQNLLSQIAYDLSQWNYSLVGANNSLGRYQFATETLENYGLLVQGSNAAYGNDCVNYLHCWTSKQMIGNVNRYQNYLYNIANLNGFLTNTVAQEHLAYQYIVDLYVGLTGNGAIKDLDSPDVVAGMIYVAWTLGVGQAITESLPQGSGAFAWRYYAVGNGINSYNSGRFAITVL